MLRTINLSDTPESPDVITWKKIGGGSLRFKGKIIKPNQTFQATKEEIPKGFLDLVVPTDFVKGDPTSPRRKPAQGTSIDPKIKAVEVVYTVQARETGGGWYDVVDSNGKALNEKALKKDIAEKLVHDLSK